MNDIFISYAHIDDQPFAEGEKGWIAKFHRCLEVRLSQLLGQKPKIWRDPKLTGNDYFAEAIVSQLPAVKILVSVLSPRYVKSEWCVREVAEFCRQCEKQGGIRIRDRSRVFKVIKTPVDSGDLPSPLDKIVAEQLGFEFFELDPETGRPHEYNDELGEEARRRFLEKVYDVAHDICATLNLLDEGSAQPNEQPAGKTVYLALTTSDCQHERERLARELSERGHVVLPAEPLPMVSPDFETAVGRLLDQSDLAVHLIGQRYGVIPEDAQISAVEIQNNLAAERTPPLPRFLWLAKEREVRDERQAALVRRLKESPEAQRGADLVEDTIEKLKGLILERLQPQPAPAVPGPPSPGGTRRVYLICDQRDEDSITPLEDFLFDQGFEVGTPYFEGNEAEIAAAHRQNLQACDGVLIFYGLGSRPWVEMKLMDVLQAPGYGRDKPLLAQAVCVAPPDDKNKQRFRTHQAEVIRCAELKLPDALAPFVAKLRQG